MDSPQTGGFPWNRGNTVAPPQLLRSHALGRIHLQQFLDEVLAVEVVDVKVAALVVLVVVLNYYYLLITIINHL